MCWDMVDGPCGGEEDEHWFGTGGEQEPLPVQGGLPGSLSSRRESHPVPGDFPPNVVLQRGEEVSSGTKSGGGFKFPQGLALNDLNLVEKTSARRLGIGS